MKSVPILIAVLLVASSSVAQSVQSRYANRDEVKSGKPVTFWCQLDILNTEYQWHSFSAVGVFTTRRLPQPIKLPNIGSIEVDLSSLIHGDPAMSARRIDSPTASAHRALIWTKLPPIPNALIGVVVYFQFAVYNVGSPAANLRITPMWDLIIRPS